MTIFFITSWFPSRVHPTNGNFVGRHARLVAREHRVVVVAVEVDEAIPFGTVEIVRREEYDCPIVHAYVGYGTRTPAVLKMTLRLRAYAKGLLAARKAFGKPDLLHGHVLLDGGMVAALCARIWSRPFVLTEHSSAYHEPGALRGIRRWLGRYACQKASVIMPVSDHLGWCMRERNGLTGNYRMVSNVVNEGLYRLEPPSKIAPFRLLHVSNFDEGPKNISGLLRAFTMVPQNEYSPVVLHLAGDGDLSKLQRQIDELEHSGITCSGPHTEVEIAELMRECHVMVLFSNYETQGIVLLEAQLSGRPCIGTNFGGIPDIILQGETGLLVPVGDEAALATAIIELRDTYAAYNLEQIRDRAVGLYSEAAVMKALNEVYRAAVK